VEALRRIPGFELAACVDVNAEALLEAAAALAIPAQRCFVRLEDALDNARPEAVIVATSIDNHVIPSRTVLARRVPLLVEKPFALTLREARGLVAMAADAHVPMMVGQTYRYTGMTQTLKHCLGSGRVGRIGLIVYQVYRGNKHLRPAVAALPNGVLWETAVHHVDLLRYVLGQEVVAVTAEGFAMPWSRLGTGAAMHVLLTFADGTRGMFLATYDSRPASALTIVAERGILSPWRRWLVLTGHSRFPQIVGMAPHLNPESALLKQLERAISTGEDPECSARENLRTVAVLEACDRSARERRTINPQDLFDEPI
jgi:predicted dehydrogenase